MKYREQMEERGYDEDEIEIKVAEVRAKLINQVIGAHTLLAPTVKPSIFPLLVLCFAQELKVKKGPAPDLSETHAAAAAKEAESKKFGSALGIRSGRSKLLKAFLSHTAISFLGFLCGKYFLMGNICVCGEVECVVLSC